MSTRERSRALKQGRSEFFLLIKLNEPSSSLIHPYSHRPYVQLTVIIFLSQMCRYKMYVDLGHAGAKALSPPRVLFLLAFDFQTSISLE